LYSAFECFWENNEFNKVGLLLLRALDKQWKWRMSSGIRISSKWPKVFFVKTFFSHMTENAENQIECHPETGWITTQIELNFLWSLLLK
jgi:hypothetical protein